MVKKIYNKFRKFKTKLFWVSGILDYYTTVSYQKKGNSNILINSILKTNIIWMGEFLGCDKRHWTKVMG